MKKLCMFLLCLGMMFSLAACGGSSGGGQAAEAAVSGPVLPDLQSFSNNCLEMGDTAVYEDYTMVYCWSSTNVKFVTEYIELLESYGFVQRDSHDGGAGVHITFDYTGSGDVGTFDMSKHYLDGDGIALYLYYYALSSNTEFHIAYADGLTVADTGDRTTQTLTPMSGAAGGSSGGDIGGGSSSNSSVKDCSFCDGTGECAECGGSGYLYSSASDKEDRNCWKCNNTGICTYCNGTGKQ